MLKPMIRAVLFDLDDTLMDHTSAMREGLDEWCRELGLPTGQHERFAAIERKWFAAYERGEVTHHGQRIARCREFLGKDLSEHDALQAYSGYLAAYQRNWRAFADAQPALQRALQAGLRVGVLTNGAREMQEAKLRAGKLDLPEVRLIATVDLGIPKPQATAYLAGCQVVGSTPAETLMVGDSLANDVEGARAAGLQAVHLRRDGSGDISGLDQLGF